MVVISGIIRVYVHYMVNGQVQIASNLFCLLWKVQVNDHDSTMVCMQFMCIT